MSIVANGSGTFVWCSAIPTHDPGDYGAKFAVQTTTLTWYHHVTGTTWEEIGPIGVSWPLNAPIDGEKNYGFEGVVAGMAHDGENLQIITDNGDDAPNGMVFSAGSADGSTGGSFQMFAGNSVSKNGGEFTATAGSSETSTGGGFSLQAGDNTNGEGQGGPFILRSGNGGVGGYFLMQAGSSSIIGEVGGSFNISGGNSIAPEEGTGGDLALSGGDASGPFSRGGSCRLRGGGGEVGGVVSILSGNTQGGTADKWGWIEITGPLRYTPITTAQRNLLTNVQMGSTVMVSDATANDGSTGVMQTYNGTTWKNHW